MGRENNKERMANIHTQLIKWERRDPKRSVSIGTIFCFDWNEIL
jgi:hypothetical protein